MQLLRRWNDVQFKVLTTTKSFYRFFERIFIYELISWYILHIYLFTYGTMIVSTNHNHFFGFYLLKDVTTRFEDYDSQIEDEWFILIFQNFTKKIAFPSRTH